MSEQSAIERQHNSPCAEFCRGLGWCWCWCHDHRIWLLEPLSASVNVACDCGLRFLALVRPPDWSAYCPRCAALCRVTVTLEVVG